MKCQKCGTQLMESGTALDCPFCSQAPPQPPAMPDVFNLWSGGSYQWEALTAIEQVRWEMFAGLIEQRAKVAAERIARQEHSKQEWISQGCNMKNYKEVVSRRATELTAIIVDAMKGE